MHLATYLMLLLITCAVQPLEEHPIHVSKCQIEHDLESKHLQVTLHVFIDDLEASLKLNGVDSLYLGTEFEHQDGNDRVGEYLGEHFKISVGDRQVSLNFLGKELSDDYMAFWCYLESVEPITPDNMFVEYDVLMDLYDDQKNILNLIRLDRSEEYALLDRKKRAVEIDME